MTVPQHLISKGFTGYVTYSGTGDNGVCLIGESPGEWEVRMGEPFYEMAPAGSVLERVLRRLGTSREQYLITNVCWSRPPNDWLAGAPWERDAIEAFREPLNELIARYQPKVIVPMGNIPLRRFTPYGGQGTTITHVRGYVMQGAYGAWIVPTYHPSYIVRGQQDLTGVIIHDLRRALDIAQHGFEKKPIFYITHPSLTDALKFEKGYDPKQHTLSLDIETPDSSVLDEEQYDDEDMSFTIVRISLCYQQGHAITMEWREPFITVVKRMLALDGKRRVWNERFDIPRLEANGVRVNGRIYDEMWRWKHIQPSLPKSLGFVAPFYGWDQGPWKHESSSEPEWYSCCDADALQRNGDGINADLRRLNLHESVERHVVDLSMVLRQMSRNGLPVDREKVEELRARLEGLYDERFEELQQTVPEHLKPVHPKKGYKKVPAGVDAALLSAGFDVIESISPTHVVKYRPITLEHVLKQTGMRLVRVTDLVKENGELVEREVERWAKVLPFLPKSPDQVKAYAHSKGHVLGRDRKTKRETTNADSLKRLIKKHKDDVYRLILECRNLQDYISRYVKGWKPDENGLVHATPGFWGAMYRISWRKPNIGATVADKDEEAIAQGFRECVVAPPGHLIVEGDWRGIEAVIVGWFAGDQDYMRLGSLGVHAYMASLTLARDGKTERAADLSWSDADLIECFADLKKHFPKEYDENKHGVHLSNYGGTPFLMTAMFPSSFPTQREAAKWQDFYFSTVAKKVKRWQDATIDQAHRQAFLTLPFGYRMWFWDVFHWNSKRYQTATSIWRRWKTTPDIGFTSAQTGLIGAIKGLLDSGYAEKDALAKLAWDRGEDAKPALSFLPRDTAAFVLRDTLLRMRAYAEASVLRASVHDSILGIPQEAVVDTFASHLKAEMETPVPELNGLVIKAEIKIGRNWSESGMEVWKG